MEVVRALEEIYNKAKQKVEDAESHKSWEKSNYNFDADPPCITALLQYGIFELGEINKTQFRLAAYLKTSELIASQAIAVLDEWLLKINPAFIEEYNPVSEQVDYSQLQKQNRFVVRTVYGGAQYGFSCSGIKQIAGVAKYCDKKCEESINKDITVSLFDATQSKYRGNRLEVVAECIGRQDQVMIIPKVVKAACTAVRNSGQKCSGCPLFGSDTQAVEYEINASSEYILRFLEPSNVPLAGRIASLVGVPRTNCARWKYSVVEQNAETLYVVPPVVNEYSSDARHTRQTVYFLGHGVKTNQPYSFSGYSHVNERNNAARLVFDKADAATGSLSEFEQTPEMVKASLVFTNKDKSPLEKCREIVQSLSYNHIRIWGRESMIMAMDLVYHSVRRFYFQNSLQRGWMNVLVIGDSGQGKSVTADTLMQFYDLGYKASAEASTRAGLLYGVNIKGNTPTHLIWGALPRYSGRIVVIDELKHLIKIGAFGELTEARSSGVVNVDTIVSGKALAETRLIMLTNPFKRRRMGSYMYPVESIQDLIEDLEDTRRFDLVVGVASKEIDDAVLHQDIREMPKVPDIYSAEACKNHLLWIWNLNPEDVVISDIVEKKVLEVSLAMCKMYSSVIPIVEPADQRVKIARLAVAIAARVNSVNEGKLLILEEHVTAAADFMMELYNSEALKYNAFSDVNAKLFLQSDDIDDLAAQFKNDADWALYWKKAVYYIAETGYIRPKFMAAVIGCEVTVAVKMLDWFAANRLFKMLDGSRYVKDVNGVTFVTELIKRHKEMLAEGRAKLETREGEGKEF